MAKKKLQQGMGTQPVAPQNYVLTSTNYTKGGAGGYPPGVCGGATNKRYKVSCVGTILYHHPAHCVPMLYRGNRMA